MRTISEKTMDTRARRAARRVSLIARRSRWRRDTVDNYGGFQLINDRNRIIAGYRFDLSPEEAIDYCSAQTGLRANSLESAVKKRR